MGRSSQLFLSECLLQSVLSKTRNPNISNMSQFRVTMAAIDPTETPQREDVDDTSEPFAVLKVTRIIGGLEDEDDSDFDEDDLDSDEDSDDEELNGGPSDPKKSKSLKKQALLEALAADEDEDEDEDMEDGSEDESGDEAEAQEVLAKLKQALKEDKGKGKATDEEDDSDDESDESVEIDETVICTLNRNNFPQQTLDFTVGPQEQVFFKVIGNFTVHVTGNYVLPPDADDEHDLEPDSDEELDELDGLDDLVGDSDSEIDELDDLEDPRIAEIEDDEEEEDENEMKKLIKQAGELKKGKNKRPADDSDDDEPALDDMIQKSLKQEDAKKGAAAAAAAAEPATNGETKKLSKAEKKRLKKLKNNEGAAVDAPAAAEAAPETNGAKDKKVQFAKELEQGPTPSPASNAKSAATTPAASASTTSVRTVQGITVDDRKIGNGPAAKKGSTLSMRYIGKLQNGGKQFDANKSGKPFSFKLGAGEVIKGWEIGLEGMQNGGERRITIPANLGYGKKGAPPSIPPNSTLIFDVKCVGVK
jgi:FK506-binding nuclear protein